ncbi:hypothetical protein SARC_15808 [Sphaeroforma arctica JP610]|uniref:Uncharacterized protein n=1 Tax=Sphaeroforma arctica JP610 TaxID=667725 RepID=A0A0L0F4P2_9EUKA|nr:hypothetical protein SARC_15808 [Sphaeroforma arctica JP610]KNC71652.1 hypothetical protein SARC_15808 [Sphaeroforma arctica JP610]|eukprot:XP_014145554.1 hypothetical protein SARC_15808 [Sphaeroforma arctica JP610]
MAGAKRNWARCYKATSDHFASADHNNALEGASANLYGALGKKVPYTSMMDWVKRMAETVLSMNTQEYVAPTTAYTQNSGVTSKTVVDRLNNWQRTAADMRRHNIPVRVRFVGSATPESETAELRRKNETLERERKQISQLMFEDSSAPTLAEYTHVVQEIKRITQILHDRDVRTVVTTMVPGGNRALSEVGKRVKLTEAAKYDVVRFETEGETRVRARSETHLDKFLWEKVLGVIEVTRTPIATDEASASTSASGPKP